MQKIQMWNTVSKTEIVEYAFYVHQGWKLTPTLSILFQIQKVICYRLHSGLCVCIQSCPTLCNPIDYSLPDSSVHGIFWARILEWVAISISVFFIYLNLFMVELGLPCVTWVFSSCSERASPCCGFCRCGARALGQQAQYLSHVGLAALQDVGS